MSRAPIGSLLFEDDRLQPDEHGSHFDVSWSERKKVTWALGLAKRNRAVELDVWEILHEDWTEGEAPLGVFYLRAAGHVYFLGGADKAIGRIQFCALGIQIGRTEAAT